LPSGSIDFIASAMSLGTFQGHAASYALMQLADLMLVKI